MLDNIKLAADAATLSPVALFLQADIVVKAVMIGLLLASIYVWTVIFTHGRSVSKLMSASERFERDFWRADNIDKFFDKNGTEELPSAKVLGAGISEWRRSTKVKTVDRDGTRERLGIAMNSAVAGEVDRLAEKIGTLATIGSVAPFVGLFGTVWGIMRSFTAIGLFAAIPAVIAYNAFSQRLNRLESRLGRFADGLHATFSRELEVEA